MEKEDAHTIAPVAASLFVNQPSDLEVYNKRLKISKNMLAAMDVILAAVGEEEQMLAKNIEIEKQKVIDSITQSFEKLRETLSAEYQTVREIAEQGKVHIKQYEKIGEKAVEMWTSISVHLSEIKPLLLQVSEFCSESIVVRIEETRKELHNPIYNSLKKWETTVCMCDLCVSARSILMFKPSTQSEEGKGKQESPSLQKPPRFNAEELKAESSDDESPSSIKLNEKKEKPAGMPLSIESVKLGPVGNLVVTVRKNWEGECEGYLSIMKNGERIEYNPNVQSFTGLDEIDLISIFHLEPENYDVVVMDLEWKNSLSEKHSIAVSQNPSIPDPDPDPYHNSIVYKNTGNIEEIEEFIKNQSGEAGLRVFKHLATEWKNPSFDEVNEFVLAVLGVCDQDEAAAKTALQLQGFQF